MSYGFGHKETRWFLKGGPTKIDFSMLKCSEEHLEFVRQTAIFLPSPLLLGGCRCQHVFFNHCQLVFISSSGNFFNAKHISKTNGFCSNCLKKGAIFWGTYCWVFFLPALGRKMKAMRTNGKKSAKRKNGTKRRRRSGKIGSRRIWA